ncbi:MAG: restriction endonuclease subunit S [Clostridia bacterium]|nr:restriction endonuclease subunit S [Clostridia bacterium]
MKCIEDEIPFDLPDGWAWMRLASLIEMFITGPFGSALHKSDYVADGIPLINPMNIIEGKIVPIDKMQVSRETVERLSTFKVTSSDIVIARRGDMGRCAVVQPEQEGWLCGTGSFVLRFPIVLCSEYIAVCLRSPYSVEYLSGNSIGNTMLNLNQAILKSILLPVPPCTEQKRIINAVFVANEHLAEISNQSEALVACVAKTKAKILDLAIRGQLVPQDPTDEPASVLLERIRAEKEELIKQGKIKRDKKESVIFRGEDNSYYEKIGDYVRCIDSELPFELPDSWMFVRLKHIGEVVGGGTPKTNISEYWDGNIPWLTPADFSGYEEMYVSSGARTITEIGLKSSSAQMLPANSVLYSSRAPIGYIAIAANPVSTNQGFKSVVPYDFSMSPYLYYCLKARTDDIIQRATGTTFKEISGSEMAETIIPLPPFTEQKRLVAKATQLLNVIATIEKSLS